MHGVFASQKQQLPHHICGTIVNAHGSNGYWPCKYNHKSKYIKKNINHSQQQRQQQPNKRIKKNLLSGRLLLFYLFLLHARAVVCTWFRRLPVAVAVAFLLLLLQPPMPPPLPSLLDHVHRNITMYNFVWLKTMTMWLLQTYFISCCMLYANVVSAFVYIF